MAVYKYGNMQKVAACMVKPYELISREEVKNKEDDKNNDNKKETEDKQDMNDDDKNNYSNKEEKEDDSEFVNKFEVARDAVGPKYM